MVSSTDSSPGHWWAMPMIGHRHLHIRSVLLRLRVYGHPWAGSPGPSVDGGLSAVPTVELLPLSSCRPAVSALTGAHVDRVGPAWSRRIGRVLNPDHELVSSLIGYLHPRAGPGTAVLEDPVLAVMHRVAGDPVLADSLRYSHLGVASGAEPLLVEGNPVVWTGVPADLPFGAGFSSLREQTASRGEGSDLSPDHPQAVATARTVVDSRRVTLGH